MFFKKMSCKIYNSVSFSIDSTDKKKVVKKLTLK